MSQIFEASVVRGAVHDDVVGREAFVNLAARTYHYGGPTVVNSEDLGVLEYFGLLMPTAKLLVPPGSGTDFEVADRRVDAPDTAAQMNVSSAVFTVRGQQWMFPVHETSGQTTGKQTVTGDILFRQDVDYWRALRGIRPDILDSWEKTQRYRRRFYEQSPFDMPVTMLHLANRQLDGRDVIPMYRADDAGRFPELLSLLCRPLPLAYAVMACGEAQKRSRKPRRKIAESRRLRDEVWGLVVSDFELGMKRQDSSAPAIPKIHPIFTATILSPATSTHFIKMV